MWFDQVVKWIKDVSSGRFEIKFFFVLQFGLDIDFLIQICSGGVDFFNIVGFVFLIVVFVVGIVNVGFVFIDYGQVWSVMDGDFGKLIVVQIEKIGVLVMVKFVDNMFWQIFLFIKLIKMLVDFVGYWICVLVLLIFILLFKLFGVNLMLINFNELYMVLQIYLVDGQENGW